MFLRFFLIFSLLHAVTAWDCDGKTIELRKNTKYPITGTGHYNMQMECTFTIPQWKEHYIHPVIKLNGGPEDFVIIQDAYGRHEIYREKFNVTYKHELVSAVDLTVILRTKPSTSGGHFEIMANYSSFYYMEMNDSESFNVTAGAPTVKIVQSSQQKQKHYTFISDEPLMITVDYHPLDPRVGNYTVFAFEGSNLRGNYLGPLNPRKGEFIPIHSQNGTISIVAVNSLSQGMIIARTVDDFIKYANYRKMQKFLKTEMQEHTLVIDAKIEPVVVNIGVLDIHFTDMCMWGKNAKLLWYYNETFPMGPPTEIWTRHNASFPVPMRLPRYSTFIMHNGEVTIKYKTVRDNNFTDLVIGDGAWFASHTAHDGNDTVTVEGVTQYPGGSQLNVRVLNCEDTMTFTADGSHYRLGAYQRKSKVVNRFRLSYHSMLGKCLFHWKVVRTETMWSSVKAIFAKD